MDIINKIDEALNEGNIIAEGREDFKNITVKIPSFTIKFDGRLNDYGTPEVSEPYFSIDTFDNNIQKALEDNMGKAIVKELQKRGIVPKKFKQTDFGEWGSGWPKGFRFK